MFYLKKWIAGASCVFISLTALADPAPTPTAGQLQQYQDAMEVCKQDESAENISMIAWTASAALCGYNCVSNYFMKLRSDRAIIKAAITPVQTSFTQTISTSAASAPTVPATGVPCMLNPTTLGQVQKMNVDIQRLLTNLHIADKQTTKAVGIQTKAALITSVTPDPDTGVPDEDEGKNPVNEKAVKTGDQVVQEMNTYANNISSTAQASCQTYYSSSTQAVVQGCVASCQAMSKGITTSATNIAKNMATYNADMISTLTWGKYCSYVDVGVGALDGVLAAESGNMVKALEGVGGAMPGAMELLLFNNGQTAKDANGAGVMSCLGAGVSAAMAFMSMNNESRDKKCVEQNQKNIESLQSNAPTTTSSLYQGFPFWVKNVASCVMFSDAIADSTPGFVQKLSACQGDLAAFSSKMACMKQGNPIAEAVEQASGGQTFEAIFSGFEKNFGMSRDALFKADRNSLIETMASLIAKDNPELAPQIASIFHEGQNKLGNHVRLVDSSSLKFKTPATASMTAVTGTPANGEVTSDAEVSREIASDPVKGDLHLDHTASLFDIISHRYQSAFSRM